MIPTLYFTEVYCQLECRILFCVETSSDLHFAEAFPQLEARLVVRVMKLSALYFAEIFHDLDSRLFVNAWKSYSLCSVVIFCRPDSHPSVHLVNLPLQHFLSFFFTSQRQVDSVQLLLFFMLLLFLFPIYNDFDVDGGPLRSFERCFAKHKKMYDFPKKKVV